MLRRVTVLAVRNAHCRPVSTTRVLRGGQTTVSAVLSALPPAASVPTIDHLMTVERAAQLMAEQHVDALPVIKNNKVVGVFTEHDYFDKVLNASHSAVRSSKVCDVATMGSELAIAHPDDTVEDCLEVMTKKHLSAIPVVEHDGHVMGTVSMMDLTKEMLSTTNSLTSKAAAAVASVFSEPSHFPENITAAGGGYHDDIAEGVSSPEQLQKLYEQLKHDLDAKALTEAAMPPVRSFDSAAAERFNLDPNLHARAAESFSEASTFPEYTPSEDELFTQTHGAATEWRGMTEAEILREEDKYALAQSSLLDEMKAFSEPSDFPECHTVEEAIAARERGHATA
ncbi:hypothetical protein PybrP1_007523 [[Pythium] brassicae (nom. inval.)]|nr:hypothetical protein PybrP1_007523 [[Pythium] brassicae (nom. inval.)]